MKVIVTREFNDIVENKKREVGDVFECTEERANFLVENTAVEIIEEKKMESQENKKKKKNKKK